MPLTLSIKIAQELYIIWSSGPPTTLKHESFEGKGNVGGGVRNRLDLKGGAAL